MRHRKTVSKLNRTAEHRKALLANLAGALFEKKRIKTTHAKAKATQRFVERLITIAKKDTVHARRLVLKRVRHKSVMHTLFQDVAPTYLDRNGGYTRVIRLGSRPGDGAEISVLELVGFEEAMKKKAKEKKEKESKTAEKKKEVPVTKEDSESKEPIREAAENAPEKGEESATPASKQASQNGGEADQDLPQPEKNPEKEKAKS